MESRRRLFAPFPPGLSQIEHFDVFGTLFGFALNPGIDQPAIPTPPIKGMSNKSFLLTLKRYSQAILTLVAGAAMLLLANGAQAQNIVISEFLAANTSAATGLRDDDNTLQDWIELHNVTGDTIILDGWVLTNSPNFAWPFPNSVTIAPGGYLIVFASDKNRGSSTTTLHTNFKLGKSGNEYVGLRRPDNSVASGFDYEQQADNILLALWRRRTGSCAQHQAWPTDPYS